MNKMKSVAIAVMMTFSAGAMAVDADYVNTRVDEVQSTVGGLQTSVQSAHDRVGRTEVRLDEMHNNVVNTQNAAQIANEHADRLDVRADNIEAQAANESERVGRVEVRADNAEEGIRAEQAARETGDKQTQQAVVDNAKRSQDALNKESAQRVASVSAVNSRVDSFENRVNSKFRDIDKRFDETDRHIDAAVSGVAAMSNIPQVTESQKFAVGAGVGARGDQSAIAVGFSARASENVVVKASVAGDSQQKWTVGGGLSYGW